MSYFKKIIGGLIVTTFVVPFAVSAAEVSEALPYYKYVTDVPEVEVLVPTKVEIAYIQDDEGKMENPLVYEKNSNNSIQSTIKTPQRSGLQPRISVTQNSGGRTSSLRDDDRNTFYTLKTSPNNAKQDGTWISTISVTWSEAVSVSEVTLALDTSENAPLQIAVESNTESIIPWQSYTEEVISFEKAVESRYFRIKIQHDSDIKVTEVDVPYSVDPYTRLSFLMQPDESYAIYSAPTPEVPRHIVAKNYRSSTQEPQFIGNTTPKKNDLYWKADHDEDGVPTELDNCPEYANADQADLNANKIGDVCEDFDDDRVVNALDNCPDRPNGNQRDTDADGIGDECDPEESRLTEQYEWVPFVGIGVAAVVLILLFISVTISTRKMKEEEDQVEEN